jgi:hypothetical protein
MPETPRGRPLATDPTAASAGPGVPAFAARPEGAPVYHGFPVLDVEVDGFRLGVITDFLAEPTGGGDAFVVAPDGSRAGLVWQTGPDTFVRRILPPEPGRWGVWSVSQPLPMTTPEEARGYLAALLPELREHWDTWRRTRGGRA